MGNLTQVFSPSTVAKISEDEITLVAAENEEIRDLRRVLEERLNISRSGLDTYKAFCELQL